MSITSQSKCKKICTNGCNSNEITYLHCERCNLVVCEECVHDDKFGDYTIACECGRMLCKDCFDTRNDIFVDDDGWMSCKTCVNKNFKK